MIDNPSRLDSLRHLPPVTGQVLRTDDWLRPNIGSKEVVLHPRVKHWKTGQRGHRWNNLVAAGDQGSGGSRLFHTVGHPGLLIVNVRSGRLLD
jgi:hypothetical protein